MKKIFYLVTAFLIVYCSKDDEGSSSKGDFEKYHSNAIYGKYYAWNIKENEDFSWNFYFGDDDYFLMYSDEFDSSNKEYLDREIPGNDFEWEGCLNIKRSDVKILENDSMRVKLMFKKDVKFPWETINSYKYIFGRSLPDNGCSFSDVYFVKPAGIIIEDIGRQLKLTFLESEDSVLVYDDCKNNSGTMYRQIYVMKPFIDEEKSSTLSEFNFCE